MSHELFIGQRNNLNNGTHRGFRLVLICRVGNVDEILSEIKLYIVHILSEKLLSGNIFPLGWVIG